MTLSKEGARVREGSTDRGPSALRINGSGSAELAICAGHAPGNGALAKADIRRIFYGLMLSGFLSSVNQTIVATALPTIGRDLGDFVNREPGPG